MAEVIRLTGLQTTAEIGVLDREKGRAQHLWVDLVLEADLLAAARADDLTLTVDYSLLPGLVAEICGERHRHLIETLAYDIARRLLGSPVVLRATVTVHKPAALAEAADTSVTISLTRPA